MTSNLNFIVDNSIVSPTIVPAERVGTVEDIGGLVLYLASRAVSTFSNLVFEAIWT